MKVALVSIFPELLNVLESAGVSSRAVRDSVVQLKGINPRDFANDRHRRVDDRPYGGGPGMVMQPEPLEKALAEGRRFAGVSAPVIYLSPQGERFDDARARSLARAPGMVLLAGRYEGVDERLLRASVDQELSIGDYVLSGGELAALVVIDAVVRLLPGVLGHADSAQEDSFANGLLDCPHFTRPETYAGQTVPEVLLSGDHEAIRRWRLKQGLGRTWERRPDLLEKRSREQGLNKEEQSLLAEYQDESARG